MLCPTLLFRIVNYLFLKPSRFNYHVKKTFSKVFARTPFFKNRINKLEKQAYKKLDPLSQKENAERLLNI